MPTVQHKYLSDLFRKHLTQFLNGILYSINLLFPNKVNNKIVLLYHRVNTPQVIRKNLLKSVFVPVEKFYRQMEYISTRDNVIITFDDGYRDNYEYAFPILKKFSIPAIFFISTGFIEKQYLMWIDIVSEHVRINKLPISESTKLRTAIKSLPLTERTALVKTLVESDETMLNDSPMSWEQIKEMSDAGMIIGDHTINHIICGNETEQYVVTELTNSQKLLQSKTGITPEMFAYPDGNIGNDPVFIEDRLKKLGYKLAFTTKRGVWSSSDNAFFINRIPIYEWDTFPTFVNKSFGLNIVDTNPVKSFIQILMRRLGIRK